MSPGAVEPVVKGVSRSLYDISHLTMQVGALGSLQTLSCIPVCAGDSLELDFQGIFRLSPLRRNLYMDTMVDLFAFYIPHRHIYGDDWLTFIKAGMDEATTFGTDTMAAGVRMACLGLQSAAASALPRWLSRGYIQIWNRYFRDPSDVAGILAEDYFTTLAVTDPIISYGINCCHMKRIWNAAILPTISTADYRLPLSGGEVDLYELSQLQGRLKTEQARDYFATRYEDIMNYSFQSHVNIDADKRPQLLMHQPTWLSGHDVDGTDQATLGSFSGKALGQCGLRFPMRFFPEHGCIWLMALLRFPPVHMNETHYLVLKPEPTYLEIAGDPAVVGRRGPIQLDADDVFVGGGAVDLGDTPYAQWYREHPHCVHPSYATAQGHPFMDFIVSSRNVGIYIPHDRYDNVFLNMDLKHWNCQGLVQVQKKTFVPDPLTSVFAGTGLPGVH